MQPEGENLEGCEASSHCERVSRQGAGLIYRSEWREIIEQIAPLGPVYQAGTLAGNPLAMAAGLATLEVLTLGLHARIAERTARLAEGLKKIAAALDVPLVTGHAGSMWGM